MVLIFSKLIDAIISYNLFIEVVMRYCMMCDYESVIISLIIILLAVIILLLLYLLTAKNCLWETDQVNSSSLPHNKFLRLFNQQSRATRHPSILNGENFRARHILCRKTPPPPELNLLLIDFGDIYFLWIWARSPSHEQWYYGLTKLEVKFLKVLPLWASKTPVSAQEVA